jgi:hypothetical protein
VIKCLGDNDVGSNDSSEEAKLKNRKEKILKGK